MNKRMRVTAFNSYGSTTQFNYWDMTLIYKAVNDLDGLDMPDLLERAKDLQYRITKLGGLDAEA